MRFRTLLTLTPLLRCTIADITFTSPSAGASVSGTTLSIEWTDSGSPALASYTLFLCAGGNDSDNFVQLATLENSGDPSSGALTATIQPGVGGTGKNAYFLKMIGAATGGTIVSYSSRFSLTSMTGTFPPQVQSGLTTVTGTSGPPNQNNVAQVNNGGAAASSGAFAVPYSLQTGPTRYAPMAALAGTVITAKNPSMQYPSSAYNVFSTPGGPPNAQITVSQPQTFSVSSVENPVAAAPMPTDTNMQKYLARWKD